MRRPTAAVVTILLLLAGGVALAGVKLGDVAPPIAGREFVNVEPVRIEDLRGQIVVVEFFRTSSKPSVEQAAKLDEFQARYEGRNVVVLAVTNEERKVVDAYVAEHKVKHAIVIESGDSTSTWGLVKGYPTLYVVDPEGKITWCGNWLDKAELDVAALLLKAKPWAPPVPARFAAAREAAMAGRLAEGRGVLDGELKAGTVADAEKPAVQKLIEWIDAAYSKALTAAVALANSGKLYEGVIELERLSKECAGRAIGRSADEGIKQVLSDPTRKREVDAGRALAAAMEAATAEPKKAASLYKAVIAKWKNTEAAKRAAELVAALEKAPK